MTKWRSYLVNHYLCRKCVAASSCSHHYSLLLLFYRIIIRYYYYTNKYDPWQLQYLNYNYVRTKFGSNFVNYVISRILGSLVYEEKKSTCY